MSTLRRLLYVVIALAAIAIIVVTSFSYWLMMPRHHESVDLFIKEGTSVRQIAKMLSEKKIITHPKIFMGYVYFSNAEKKLHAGDYTFAPDMSIHGVVQKLLKGDYRTYRITVVEGWNMRQIADYLSKLEFMNGKGFADDFMAKCKDKNFIQSLGLSEDSLEGYLFPNTYDVYRNEDATKIIKKLVQEFKKNYTPEMIARASELKMSQHDVVTLASIVEKETGAKQERPLIASVFFNRLKIDMPLQSDPTIIYGLPNYDGNIRKEDIHNPHKYNTYVHGGLPPGPIASPGLASIKAVLWPEQSEYLYFVAKNDGTHYFSKNLSEHNQAVQQYQLNKKQE